MFLKKKFDKFQFRHILNTGSQIIRFNHAIKKRRKVMSQIRPALPDRNDKRKFFSDKSNRIRKKTSENRNLS